MKIIIFGAGAIGSYFGASLLLGGNEVYFLERKAAAEQLLKTGITLRKKGMVQKVSGLNVYSSLSRLISFGPFDLGILAVKSYDTRSFLGSLQGHIRDLPPILSLQNGVENEDLIASVVGTERVIAGSVTTAIGRNAPGEITVEKLRGVGVAGKSPLTPEVVSMFNQAGLQAKQYSSTMDMKWSKMLTNLPANASAAILNMIPGEIFADTGLFSIEMEQLRETLAVMRSQNIKVVNLPGTPVSLLALGSHLPAWLGKPLIGKFLSRGRGDKKPSFLIELQNQTGKSEVGYLNGAVAKAGNELGIRTPVNTALNRVLEEIVDGKVNWSEYDHKPERLIRLVQSEKDRS